MTNLKLHRFAAALMTGLVACALCAAAPAAPQVRVAVSSDAITLLPVHLAQTLGYYKEEGLDVTLSLIGSANQTLDALHDGSVNVALGTTVPIQTAAAGRSIQGFLVIYATINNVLIVSPAANADIHSIADLKGRRIGVSNLGSGSQIFLNYLLTANGLPPADVKAVAIGVGAPALAAIARGDVDAALLVGSSINALLKDYPGLTILADTRTPEGSGRVLGPVPFPGSLLVAEESWLKANPDTARRFVRAVRKAMQWMGEHSAQEVRANMREDQRAPDAQTDLETIRDFQHMLSPDGAIQKGSPELMYKVLAASLDDVRSAHIDLSQAYTNEYLGGK
jgi:NitT/TauT family transport system substrate-binding protein